MHCCVRRTADLPLAAFVRRALMRSVSLTICLVYSFGMPRRSTMLIPRGSYVSSVRVCDCTDPERLYDL